MKMVICRQARNKKEKEKWLYSKLLIIEIYNIMYVKAVMFQYCHFSLPQRTEIHVRSILIQLWFSQFGFPRPDKLNLAFIQEQNESKVILLVMPIVCAITN